MDVVYGKIICCGKEVLLRISDFGYSAIVVGVGFFQAASEEELVD